MRNAESLSFLLDGGLYLLLDMATPTLTRKVKGEKRLAPVSFVVVSRKVGGDEAIKQSQHVARRMHGKSCLDHDI